MYNNYECLSDKLESDEVIFAIKVEHVQDIADSMGMKPLNYSEMDSVRKGVEWGLDFWGDIVKDAIKNIISDREDSNNNKENNG